MNTKTFALAIAMGSLLIGCKSDKGDSGDSGATNACGDDGSDGTDGTDGDGGSSIDSCDWGDLNVCFEFDGYSDTSSWCSDIGDTYGISTSYNASDCPDGAIGQCDLTSAGGDFPSGASAITGFYYEGTSDPQGSCEGAGGTYAG